MLQETKSNSDILHTLISRLWRGNRRISVNSFRASSGLTITWNLEEVELDNFLDSRYIIFAHFHPLGTNLYGRITNVYGLQLPYQKNSFLYFLHWLTQDQPYPIEILGEDFNIITYLKDKWGWRCILSQEEKLFKEFIDNNSLIDLDTNNGNCSDCD